MRIGRQESEVIPGPPARRWQGACDDQVFDCRVIISLWQAGGDLRPAIKSAPYAVVYYSCFFHAFPLIFEWPGYYF